MLAAEARVDAYLDPGSGSMLVQLLLGGVAGAAVIMKLGWERFKTCSAPRARSEAETKPMSEIALEPGSFRDRTARVFYHDGKIFRGLNETALKEWQALSATQFLSPLVGHRRHRPDPAARSRHPCPPKRAARRRAISSGRQCSNTRRLPFVSYPYEWSFEMLRDAALLQLDLVLAALDEGIGLKDASAYNLQWNGASPVFVDVASFYKRAEGEPWVGYRQFCQMFLYPLLLQAYRDVPFQPWMRGNIDGMDAEVCLNLLSARDYLRGGVLAHVYLQAKAQKAYNAHDARRAQGSEQGGIRQAHHQGQRRSGCARLSPACSGSRSSRPGPTI